MHTPFPGNSSGCRALRQRGQTIVCKVTSSLEAQRRWATYAMYANGMPAPSAKALKSYLSLRLRCSLLIHRGCA